MKKLLFTTLLTAAAALSFAQHGHTNSQPPAKTNTASMDSITQKQLAQLLSSYYRIKDALVSGDAAASASRADSFLRTANAIDFKVLSEGNIQILAKDAGRISEVKDIGRQREYFAALSSNMATIAKSLSLTKQPVYLQYCPMKKAYWLSAEKEVRNPYYGSAMLTCGEVTATY